MRHLFVIIGTLLSLLSSAQPYMLASLRLLNRLTERPSLVQIADLNQLKDHLDTTTVSEPKSVKPTCIRFSSASCKTCQRSRTPFAKLSRQFQTSLSFVEVETGPKTADIFLAFNITRLPYYAIIHPDPKVGHVESGRCGPSRLKEFSMKVRKN